MPVIFMGIIVIAGFFLLRNLSSKVQLPNPTDMFANERKAKFMRVDVASKHGHGISFKDVAGLTEAKTEIMEFVDYLKTPQRFKELGAKIPRGALLLGPPGCGKTLLARAVATEAKVPFLAMAGSEFVEMLGGPWVLNMEEEHTLNQLLVEMDGNRHAGRCKSCAIADPRLERNMALLRPGRFDRHIMIDLPTLIERREIFNLYLSKLKLAHPPETYSNRLAQMTPGMSGADISNICNEAAIHAAREGKKIIDTPDFEYAAERMIAGVEKKTRLLAPTEKKMVAYHESGHALVGWLLKYTDALIRNTDPIDGIVRCKRAQDDLKKVTKMAYDQIRSYGMNERLGHLSFPADSEGSVTKPYSRKLQATIDEEAQALVARAFQYTVKVLQDNKEKLHKVLSLGCQRISQTVKGL
nr:hypothetical protein BaRGS_029765 [Batillaria attramentaria]